MSILVTLDTNVVVSAHISKNPCSPTVCIFRAVLDGLLTPLYHPDIIAEYREVLNRPKFRLKPELVEIVLSSIVQFGVEIPAEITPSSLGCLDEDDRIFYEITLNKLDMGACLVTGNKRHFPDKKFVMTPAKLVEILGL